MKDFFTVLSDEYIPLKKKGKKPVSIFLVESEKDLPILVCEKDIKYSRNLGFFSGKVHIVTLSEADGEIKCVLIRRGPQKARFTTGEQISKLPDGEYEIKTNVKSEEALEIALGFCLSAYTFYFYKKRKTQCAVQLVVPKCLNFRKLIAFIKSEYLVRNLINTPASDLGPVALENFIKTFSRMMGAKFQSFSDEKDLKKNFPLISAVGAAGSESARLINFTWGNKNSRKISLVGKGVCFDTGGLNIKSDSSMAIMKKDMGGAASILGLAFCIMSLDLNVNLSVTLPIVENSISSKSFRPSDILLSRKGLSVEINNTDAEGRLILADSINYADERSPDVMICMATLTGAARVALGGDIVPFYTDCDYFSELLLKGSKDNFDPLWRFPFHAEYEYMIDAEIGDLDNAPGGGMAGSITAALFLRRFVDNSKVFVHFDLYAWSSTARPGRQVGGLMQAVRATFFALEAFLNND